MRGRYSGWRQMDFRGAQLKIRPPPHQRLGGALTVTEPGRMSLAECQSGRGAHGQARPILTIRPPSCTPGLSSFLKSPLFCAPPKSIDLEAQVTTST